MCGLDLVILFIQLVRFPLNTFLSIRKQITTTNHSPVFALSTLLVRRGCRHYNYVCNWMLSRQPYALLIQGNVVENNGYGVFKASCFARYTHSAHSVQAFVGQYFLACLKLRDLQSRFPSFISEHDLLCQNSVASKVIACIVLPNRSAKLNYLYRGHYMIGWPLARGINRFRASDGKFRGQPATGRPKHSVKKYRRYLIYRCMCEWLHIDTGLSGQAKLIIKYWSQCKPHPNVPSSGIPWARRTSNRNALIIYK